jgi:hypothetical protein
MTLTLWKTKSEEKTYRNLTVVGCSWWMCAPINIKCHNYGGCHFGFEFMPIGFNKYNQGWSFRLMALKLIWVGQ